jgi:hypothetical protein
MGVAWTVTGVDSRGPPLIAGDDVYVVTRDGHMNVIGLRNGSTSCSIPTRRQFDRAGPSLAGNALIFASLEGDLIALPLEYLTRCDTAAVARALAPGN